jgi:apolipoprotein N-acyltransferase
LKFSALKLWQRHALAALAGLSLAAAFPNAGVAGLAWLAPALLLAAVSGTHGRRTFALAWTAGFASALAQLHWLLCIPVTGFPILGWAALSAYCALFTATWVWLVSSFEFRVSGWGGRTAFTFFGAAAWVALEFVRGHFLTGFPWNPLGASQFKLTPLLQLAAFTGVHGVSFLVVFASLALFNGARAVVRHPTRRLAWQQEIILPLVVVLAVFTFGVVKLREPQPAEKILRVAAVQPAIPQTIIWDARENTNRFHQLLALSETAATNCEVLIWPEAALPELNETTFAAISDLARRHGVWMIFGGDDVEPTTDLTRAGGYEVFNAAFLLTPRGQVQAIYRKHDLVIFGEYIPLVRWLPFLKYLSPIGDGFSAGDGPVPFELPLADAKINISPLICFEDVFAATARRATTDDTDLLLNLTNDGWFGQTSAQWQQAAAAVFRAVENGAPLLRSCNTGLTCWVDSRGRIRETFRDAHGTIYGAGIFTTQIPLPARAETFYHQHGDWFAWLCAAVAVAMCARVRFARR